MILALTLTLIPSYETDVTVTKLEHEKFIIISPTAQATRDADWIRRNIRTPATPTPTTTTLDREGEFEFATVTDITSSLVVLAVMGPQSRELLERVTLAPLDNGQFPFGTSQEIDVGPVAVRAARVTYVGELGWELYCPVECAPLLYETLHAAASGELTTKGPTVEEPTDPEEEPSGNEPLVPIDLRDCGYYAIDSLRCEKGYRAYGHELSSVDTPLEAGLAFQCDWSKDFNGKAALLEQKSNGVKSRVVTLSTEEEALPLWGAEPVYRDGVLVGNVTSANYSHSNGGQIALCTVEHEDVATKGFVAKGTYTIEVGATMVPAKGSLRPAFDPKGRRVAGDYEDQLQK